MDPPRGSAPDAHADITAMSYEQARDELIGIVTRLEGGQVGLEDGLTLWERGEALARHCSAWLDGAQARLQAGQRPPQRADEAAADG